MKMPLVLTAVVMTLGATVAFGASPISSVGSGAKLGLNAVSDDIGAAFGVGAHADIGLNLPIPITLSYVPGFEMWFSSEEILGLESHFREINLNFLEARYYPSLPQSLPISPYAGIGIPFNISIVEATFELPVYSGYGYSYETTTETVKNRDFNVGAMLIGGTEFKVSDNLAPFAEMKLKLGDWVVYKLMGGITYRFMTRKASGSDRVGKSHTPQQKRVKEEPEDFSDAL
ncbi:MAG: hypothetical protein GF344_20495 [Chitinivibrionales bacterium]|nr:hypothetical protein [Chitinivibrionales bacterium]MBD3358982.1 hypothetical protein [Chitinivibrionales bacterium]